MGDGGVGPGSGGNGSPGCGSGDVGPGSGGNGDGSGAGGMVMAPIIDLHQPRGKTGPAGRA